MGASVKMRYWRIGNWGLLSALSRLNLLWPGIPVVAGAADQATGALGSGVIEPGVVMVTLGTGGQRVLRKIYHIHKNRRDELEMGTLRRAILIP